MTTERIIVRTSKESKTGYELVFIDDNQNEEIHPIESTYKNEPFTLILPENELNRKYLNSKKVDSAGGELELKSINRNLDPNREPSTPKTLPDLTFPKSHQKLHELMTKEEISELRCFEESIDMYMELMYRVLERVTPKKRELTDIEKAELRVKKALAALEALKNQEIQG